MIYFRFTINYSFMAYSTHPITVPKTQVDYDKLQKVDLDSGDFRIIFPKGERVDAHMYYGTAGYGPYYQLRMYTEQTLPQYIDQGDNLLVILIKDGTHKYAILEYRQ